MGLITGQTEYCLGIFGDQCIALPGALPHQIILDPCFCCANPFQSIYTSMRAQDHFLSKSGHHASMTSLEGVAMMYPLCSSKATFHYTQIPIWWVPVVLKTMWCLRCFPQWLPCLTAGWPLSFRTHWELNIRPGQFSCPRNYCYHCYLPSLFQFSPHSMLPLHSATQTSPTCWQCAMIHTLSFDKMRYLPFSHCHLLHSKWFKWCQQYMPQVHPCFTVMEKWTISLWDSACSSWQSAQGYGYARPWCGLCPPCLLFCLWGHWIPLCSH